MDTKQINTSCELRRTLLAADDLIVLCEREVDRLDRLPVHFRNDYWYYLRDFHVSLIIRLRKFV